MSNRYENGHYTGVAGDGVEFKSTQDIIIIDSPEKRAQDLFDATFAFSQTTGQRVQLITRSNGAQFFFGQIRLRERRGKKETNGNNSSSEASSNAPRI